MRRIFGILLMLFILSVPIFSSAAESRVSDSCGMLSGEELAELESELATASSECGFEIKLMFYDDVVTSSYLSETRMLDMLSADEDDDLAVLLITREYDGYYYELFLYGEPDGLIDWDASDEILDTPKAYSSIKSGKLAEGASALITAIRDVVNRIRSDRWVGVIVATVAIALLSGGGTALGIYLSYKKKQKSPSYPLSKYASLSLTDSSDVFLGSSVVKTRVSSSSSSSRGGSRGGGGSRGRR